MRKLKDYFSNFGLRAKLSFAFIALIAVTITGLAIIYYWRSSAYVYQRAGETILEFVKKGNNTLDTRFKMLEQSAVVLSVDEDLFEFFKTADLSDRQFCFDHDKQISKTVMKYFPYLEDIYSVNLVTSQFTFGPNPYFWIPKTDLSNTRIYNIGLQSSSQFVWVPTYNLIEEYYSTTEKQPTVSSQSQYVFTAVRQINPSMIKDNILRRLDESREKPVLVINFQENMIENALKECTYIDGSYFYVFDDQGRQIAPAVSNQTVPYWNESWMKAMVRQGSGSSNVEIDGQKILLCYDTIGSTGWISAVFVPYDSLIKTMPNFITLVLGLTILIGLLAIILATIFSRKITDPINHLIAGINKMGDGNFNVRVKEASRGEMAVLIKKFNEMNDKIGKLIQDNYEIKLMEIDAELKALNFQFNPHFLYNTLNTINWLAIRNEQHQISEMIVELSEMLEYTAKAEQSQVSFLEDEKYLRNYLNIMGKRFANTFKVEFDIDPRLYDTFVPKFFLQPFIENVFIHAFEDLDEGGEVSISGQIRGDERVFTIKDNGKGISEERLAHLFDEQPDTGRWKSIGIYNINQRIKLIFGETYGVSIQSSVGQGTTVVINLPLI